MVEFLHGSDVHPLVRAMRVLDSRTEGDHLHSIVFSTDDATLQTGVNRHNTRFVAKLFDVRLAHRLEQTALEIRLPSGICTAELYICAC